MFLPFVLADENLFANHRLAQKQAAQYIRVKRISARGITCAVIALHNKLHLAIVM